MSGAEVPEPQAPPEREGDESPETAAEPLFLPNILVPMLVITGVAVAAAILAYSTSMVGDPEVVVDAVSDAVLFRPSENVDLVQLGRPRFAIAPDGSRYTGIRLEPPLPVRNAASLLPPGQPVDSSALVTAIHELAVTPDCTVRLELWPGSRVSVHLGRAKADQDRPCTFVAELDQVDGAGVLTRIIVPPTDVPLEHDVIVTFRPDPWPLVLRDVPVRELGFSTVEQTPMTSAIRHATLDLPGFGRMATAYPGDWLTLGEAEGTVEVLAVGDSIRTLFKGRTSRPGIQGRDLRPSLLAQAAGSEAAQRLLAVAVGVLSILAGVIQAVRR